MDADALERSPIGKIIPITGEDARWGPFKYFAFSPDPLPPACPLSESTVAIVADAAMALGRLDMAVQRLPNPLLLVRSSLRKEAVSTSALEGTYAPLAEVLEGEIVGPDAVSAEAREILNYVRATELGVEMLRTRPLTLNLLAPLQKVLVEGTRGDSYDAGSVRKRIVMIGSQDRPIQEARFVPPPPGDDLLTGISTWEKWIHGESDTHLLVKVVLAHYQFETLHPFVDGNGRLGRLAMALQLMEAGVLSYPLLNIAEWLEPRKREYQDRLLQVSMDGDFDSWVAFLAGGIREQADASVARIDRLLALRDSILEKLRNSGFRGGTAFRLAGDLIGYPMIDVPWAAKHCGVAYQSADEALRRLVDIDVIALMRRKGKTRKLYYSRDVLRELGA